MISLTTILIFLLVGGRIKLVNILETGKSVLCDGKLNGIFYTLFYNVMYLYYVLD